ncbi:hypothetical protein BC829DRAFT_409677 [Chytridium lagenaria]|nr:hypothetical protein BC829DRAFT_409677 [Chytridium lagenaria]
MEGYPDGLLPNQICLDEYSGKYVRRHNPFASMTNIHQNVNHVSKIKSAQQFFRDLEHDRLPQYIYYTPDNDNNGHDTGFMTPRTLVIVTFDEDFGWIGSNRVATWLLGDVVDRQSAVVNKTKCEDRTRYTHYSILRTVEDNWELGDLGRHDAKAVPFRCLRS